MAKRRLYLKLTLALGLASTGVQAEDWRSGKELLRKFKWPELKTRMKTIEDITEDYFKSTLNKPSFQSALQQQATALDASHYWLQQAALQKPEFAPRSEALKQTASHEGLKNLVEQIKSQNQVFRRLENGVPFKLDLASVFSTSSPQAPRPVDHKRYGLKLRRLETTRSPQSSLSNLDSQRNNWQVRPEYTIGLIEPNETKPYGITTSQQEAAESPGFVPSAAFGGKFFVDSGGESPVAKMSLRQEQGLYEAEIPLASQEEKPETLHTFGLPIGKHRRLQRKYHEDFTPQESRVADIFDRGQTEEGVLALGNNVDSATYFAEWYLKDQSREAKITVHVPHDETQEGAGPKLEWSLTQNF